jgi:hypothetical protein
MENARFKGYQEVFQINIKNINDNMVQLYPPIPNANITAGFELLANSGKVYGNYLDYTTLFKKMEDGSVVLSNDGSVYIPPEPPVYKVVFSTDGNGKIVGEAEQEPKTFEELIIPVVIPNENYEFVKWNPEIPKSGPVNANITFTAQMQYVPTLEEIKTKKVTEMNDAQQTTIQNGLDIALSSGTVEHFTLTDHDQTSLMGLQTLVAQGVENIPWHTSDQTEHCKYYSNADMAIITSKALQFVTFHVTYFRDLRIYVRALEDKEAVSNVFYGMSIPEKYQSDVLKDFFLRM